MVTKSQCSHPNYIAAKLRSIQTQQFKKEQKISEYNKNPKECLQCGKHILYDKKSNLFCCRSCAAIYNNKRKDYSTFKSGPIQTKQILPNTTKIKPKTTKIESKISRLYYCYACGKIHKSHILRNNCLCGLSKKRQVFPNLQKYFNLKLDNIGTSAFIADYNKCVDNIDAQYHKLSYADIADAIGHYDKSGGNVAKILATINITSTKNTTTGYKFKRGQFTYDNKIYYYRSSYELEFANYLISKNIKFRMESIRFHYVDSIKNTTRIAIPDFIVDKIIIEVKSSYTFIKQNMIDKFHSYIKNGYTPFLMLDKKCYSLEYDKFTYSLLPI